MQETLETVAGEDFLIWLACMTGMVEEFADLVVPVFPMRGLVHTEHLGDGGTI
jgi:hypothetical protein